MTTTSDTIRDRMCRRKRSFVTLGDANKVADKFGQRVYLCPFCRLWHCTSQQPMRTVASHSENEEAIEVEGTYSEQRAKLIAEKLEIQKDLAFSSGFNKAELKARLVSLEAKLAEIKPLFKEEQRAQSGVDDPRLEVAREISHSLSQIAEMLSGFLDDYYGKEKYRR